MGFKLLAEDGWGSVCEDRGSSGRGEDPTGHHEKHDHRGQATSKRVSCVGEERMGGELQQALMYTAAHFHVSVHAARLRSKRADL